MLGTSSIKQRQSITRLTHPPWFPGSESLADIQVKTKPRKDPAAQLNQECGSLMSYVIEDVSSWVDKFNGGIRVKSCPRRLVFIQQKIKGNMVSRKQVGNLNI